MASPPPPLVTSGAGAGVAGDGRWTEEHVAAIREHGYAVIPGFLTAAEVTAGAADLAGYFPSPDAYFAGDIDATAGPLAGDPFAGLRDFPYAGDALNDHTLHPALISLAEAVIGERDVRVIQSRIWAKYAGAADYDQPLHTDFRNHSLLVPRDDAGFAELEVFLYYSDVTAASGPTHVVSRRHTDDLPPDVEGLDRSRHADVYAHEVAAVGAAGTALAYLSSTYHRGSAIGPPPNHRFILGVAFRAAGHEWVGHQAWPYAGMSPHMGRCIERASIRQREVLGIPPPGHLYWNDATVSGVAARYPGLDVQPYRAALAAGG